MNAVGVDGQDEGTGNASLPPVSATSDGGTRSSNAQASSSTNYKPQVLWSRNTGQKTRKSRAPSPPALGTRRSQRTSKKPHRIYEDLPPALKKVRATNNNTSAKATRASHHRRSSGSVANASTNATGEMQLPFTANSGGSPGSRVRQGSAPPAFPPRASRQPGSYIHYGPLAPESSVPLVSTTPTPNNLTFQTYQDLSKPPLHLSTNSPSNPSTATSIITPESCNVLRLAGVDPRWCILPERGVICPWGAKKGQCRSRADWNKSSWERHLYGHLPEDLRPYWQCSSCRRRFARRDSFKRHFKKDISGCWANGMDKVPEIEWEARYYYRPITIL